MRSRRDKVLAAAIDVFQSGGIHALTHRAVDARAGLPSGSTSNVFRTRTALLEALAGTLAERRLTEGGLDNQALSLAWLELLVLARRDEVVADAIAPMRHDMVALLGRRRADDLPLSDADLAALLTGLEFVATVLGRDLRPVIELLLGGIHRRTC